MIIDQLNFCLLTNQSWTLSLHGQEILCYYFGVLKFHIVNFVTEDNDRHSNYCA